MGEAITSRADGNPPGAFSISPGGVVVPAARAPDAPGHVREATTAGLRLARRLWRWLTAAVVLALLAIAVPAAVDLRNADVARSATTRATVCTSAYDDRRAAHDRGQSVPGEVTDRIERCQREADE